MNTMDLLLLLDVLNKVMSKLETEKKYRSRIAGGS